MCRFIFLLFLVVAGFFLFGSIFGVDALFWPIIIGLVGSSFGLLFLPKRGDQYAFQNLYRRLALFVAIGIVAILMGGIYAIAMLFPKDVPDESYTPATLGLLALIIGFTFLILLPVLPRTRRKGWLKRSFPGVSKSIKRYKKNGDQLEDYFPILSLETNHYFLIHYNSRKGSTITPDYLLLDEMGKPVRDEVLMKKAIKCKTLAFNTIDYASNVQRAQRIQSDQNALHGLKNLYSSLKGEQENISKHSPRAKADIEMLLAVEEDIYRVAETSIALSMLEAKWAKEHGLGKLTTVKYEDVAAFEEEMRAIRIPLVEATPRLFEIADPARRLADLFSKDLRYLPGAAQTIETLLGIADGTRELEIQNEDIYGKMKEDDWKSWRDRLAWADQVDAEAQG